MRFLWKDTSIREYTDYNCILHLTKKKKKKLHTRYLGLQTTASPNRNFRNFRLSCLWRLDFISPHKDVHMVAGNYYARHISTWNRMDKRMYCFLMRWSEEGYAENVERICPPDSRSFVVTSIRLLSSLRDVVKCDIIAAAGCWNAPGRRRRNLARVSRPALKITDAFVVYRYRTASSTDHTRSFRYVIIIVAARAADNNRN